MELRLPLALFLLYYTPNILKCRGLCRFFAYSTCHKTHRKFLIIFANSVRNPLGLVMLWLTCNVVVSKFELQLRYYVYFRVHHNHHHVMPLALISLTLSRHFSLSFIASGMSSGLHSVSSHSCWMYVCAGRPDFARPYLGVHKSTSLMSSSLLLRPGQAVKIGNAPV